MQVRDGHFIKAIRALGIGKSDQTRYDNGKWVNIVMLKAGLDVGDAEKVCVCFYHFFVES